MANLGLESREREERDIVETREREKSLRVRRRRRVWVTEEDLFQTELW